MGGIDYKQISEIILQKTYPVYVVDEKSKEILFTNSVLDAMVGRPLTGENCFKAFGDDSLPQIIPPTHEPGENYVWDYVHKKTGRLFRIQDTWFLSGNRLCRMGVVADTSDLLALNRSMADYLWLMQGLSELQAKMAYEQEDAFTPLLEFFRKHYGAKSAVISYTEGSIQRTVISDDEGIRCQKEHYQSEICPYKFKVAGYSFNLWLEQIRNADAWDEDKSFVMSIAKLYIENSILWQRLNWENCHDKLTGLLSRASLDSYVDSIYNNLECVGILYMDIDDLKKTNDYFGHEMGDTLIRKAAGVISQLTNKENHAFRMGGDEFMLVCAGATEKSLDKLFNRMTALVDDANKISDSPSLSISCGMASAKRPFDFEELMRVADKEMYTHKRSKKMILEYINLP